MRRAVGTIGVTLRSLCAYTFRRRSIGDRILLEEKRMKNMLKGALALIALPTFALAAEPMVAACCAACVACAGCGCC